MTLKEKKDDKAPEPSSPVSEPAVIMADPGMLVSAKDMYQGKKDDDGNRAWVESIPEDLDEPVETEETAQNALLVRHVKCYDGRRKLKIHSIVVQSPLIREALGKILDNYPGVQTKLTRLTFEAPFAPFVHRWARFEGLREKSTGTEREHLDLLHHILEVELADVLKARVDLLLNGVIDYDNLWMIFEPGSIVYGSKSGQPIAAKFKQGSYGKDCKGNPLFGLKCQYVDWDGRQFGWSDTVFKVGEFAGINKISELPIMPLEYCQDTKAIKTSLIERGRKWASFAGYHFRHYTGMAAGRDKQTGEMAMYSVDSRVMIDAVGWNKFEPNDAVSVRPLSQDSLDTTSTTAQDSDEEEEEAVSDEEWTDTSDNLFRLSDDDKAFESSSKHKIPKEQRLAESLTSDLLLLTTATVKGYSLKDKKWLILHLAHLAPITFSADAFSSLVLEPQQKDLVLALSSSQRMHRASFDDVVQGKGRGMIMLLAGPPGVGKTLTAESVAEVLRCPLYVVGASDLGDYTWQVEHNLLKILDMCTRWSAVALIDEADVFLEARTSADLERNKLVSVFLRTMEYYAGILFLTTNRVDNIDAAFHSRIHLSLTYPDLTAESRRKVWENFIGVVGKTLVPAAVDAVGGDAQAVDGAAKVVNDAAAPVEETEGPSFSEEDLDRLAAFDMNGREIKNVLKTAQLLASMKGEGLRFKHVKTVMNVEQRYNGRQTTLRV